mmetsp:Transcript_31621/g.74678  ORF Transcript_31621/g.74678 Transcript_31621/m.74678 type:complete len:203 (+) Transcript_31621:665-1273(+)
MRTSLARRASCRCTRGAAADSSRGQRCASCGRGSSRGRSSRTTTRASGRSGRAAPRPAARCPGETSRASASRARASTWAPAAGRPTTSFSKYSRRRSRALCDRCRSSRRAPSHGRPRRSAAGATPAAVGRTRRASYSTRARRRRSTRRRQRPARTGRPCRSTRRSGRTGAPRPCPWCTVSSSGWSPCRSRGSSRACGVAARS